MYKYLKKKLSFLFFIFSLTGLNATTFDQNISETANHSFAYTTEDGRTIKLQFYSDFVVRVQVVRPGEEFFPDDHYEMVVNHNRTGRFIVEESDGTFIIKTGNADAGLTIALSKEALLLTFSDRKTGQILLRESKAISWEETKIKSHFDYDNEERFCGMGHQSYGLVESIDLSGKEISCNYGTGSVGDWGYQAVLTVPFYLSDKGYGIFLNSTFEHQFNFGKNEKYGFEIDTKGFEGRMDYFFLYGPKFSKIIDRYTALNGRPRLPQKSIFGLQLSDKGAPKNNGAVWWKQKINEHRTAGFPFDHIVNDNRWRAGSGGWSGSWFEWDSTRYPDPAAYNNWCKEQNVTMTLDLNRNIIASCEGWQPEFNIPDAEKYVKEGYSTPDYSNPAMRNWIWQLFWNKSFDPALGFPGDALWIDEVDDLQNINESILCANGRSWAENENYYPFLIAKAIVQEGWDNENKNQPPGIGQAKRPYVWMRAMCAGAQRYATYWTGDLKCDYEWMEKTIRGMQVAGLCGFPYFNHDAGGFRHPGPDDPMYIGWSMAFGSFSPIWRPHGIGTYQRWPLDRSDSCQEAAYRYSKIRYEMMPFIYSYAHIAHETGLPMVRAMVIDYQDHPEAWAFDLQYLWGNEMLVAPACTTGDTTLSVWLPPGQNWYDYWTDTLHTGGEIIDHEATLGYLPVFIKEGSIMPRHPFALSTFELNEEALLVDIYTGKDGRFVLYEDDGVTEKFRTQNAIRKTRIYYQESSKQLIIEAANGDYDGAPSERSYEIVFHGMQLPEKVSINNSAIRQAESLKDATQNQPSFYWDKQGGLLFVLTGIHTPDSSLAITIEQ